MISTLAALVAAMTVGAFVLILMETPPARLGVPAPLQAGGSQGSDGAELAAAIHLTDVPIQYIKWRNIVIHDASCDQADPDGGCHFLVGRAGRDDGRAVRATDLWRKQRDGNHVDVPGYSYNENSIGIRLLSDTSQKPPTPEQMNVLVDLVRALQVTCQIPSDHVYLHSELGSPGHPGDMFPSKSFRSRLIAATR